MSNQLTHEIEKLISERPPHTHLPFEDRERLLQLMDQSRREIEEMFSQTSLDREIYPGWTKKEILAHLTGWEDGSLQSVKAMLAGEPPSVPAAVRGPDYYNEQSVLERSALTYEQIIGEWRLARQQFCDLVRTMTPEQFNTSLVFAWGGEGTVTNAMFGLLGHEQEHIHQIHEILEQTA
jgi:hypothetical protein